MYKIKLSIESDDLVQRQTPLESGIWGDYQFFINGEIGEADFWVVYSKGLKKNEVCLVAPENTIFITGEPITVYPYARKFVKQFNKAIVCQDTHHPYQTYSQPALPWIVGRDPQELVFTMNYDDFKEQKILQKTGLISVISSNKAFPKGHQERVAFVNQLKEYYGDKIDVFGRGIRSFDDKWDVVSPYKYHICLENSSFPHYWTEKLADCYLGEAFPLYYGCPNIADYFPNDSYRTIDINNFEESLKVIDKALEDNLYEKNLEVLIQAKNLVLDKYNLFPVITELCKQMNPNATKILLKLKSENSFFDLTKKANLAATRSYYKIKNRLK
jgi:hypothetical protein